jgi:hypothetical protein
MTTDEESCTNKHEERRQPQHKKKPVMIEPPLE